jgi:hypothetical protein
MEEDLNANPVNGSSVFIALDPAAHGERYRLCGNYTSHAVCNWAIPEHDPNTFCPSCQLNEIIPVLSSEEAVDSWRRLEIAKRRLVYTLLQLGLPVQSREHNAQTGLAFAFKQDEADGTRVLTGHCDGLVTINVNEADAPAREQTRVRLGERYRTLLGHFRHESGHYYWDRLIKDGPLLADFRARFGDEQLDYAEAVQRHYSSPRMDWADGFVSPYATMHPWEDWAETWAHYLHMVDTLETARSYGLVLRPVPIGGATSEDVAAQRLHFDDFDDLIAAWVPLTVALNSLNRSMGLPDMYPFVLAEGVKDKLRFVHHVVAASTTGIDPTLEVPEQKAIETPGLELAPAPA